MTSNTHQINFKRENKLQKCDNNNKNSFLELY